MISNGERALYPSSLKQDGNSASTICDVIGSIVFSPELQTEFAKLSGDWNPMHMNSVVARRTQTGMPIVHGIHIVLSALDSVVASSPDLPLPSSLKVRFIKPVYVGEVVEFCHVSRHNTDLHMQSVVDSMTTVDLHIVLDRISRANEKPRFPDKDDHMDCRELMLDEIAGRSGVVHLATTEDKIAARFPNAVSWMGTETVGGLMCLSRLVGMECPGLHSFFSGFEIDFPTTDTPPCLEYAVASIDKRFRRIKIDV